jgi:predicted secreted hydrolase
MNAKACLLALSLAALPHAEAASAQGFAGLGSSADGFALPDPDYRLTFPADHGAHPDFRIEWWYVTATLTGADGTEYGAQWTLFRTALAPGEAGGWQSPQLWMGHAAVTTPDAHHVAERLARGGIGQAGVTLEEGEFLAWIDDWQMQSNAPPGADAFSELTLTASGPDFSYEIDLSANGPLIAQGVQGYSVKSSEGQASHYYSQPFYQATGTLQLPQGPVAVTGQAWLDREWSSQPLAADQTGWDWFSLMFDDGSRLMGFSLHDKGNAFDFTSGTFIAPDGTATPLAPGMFRADPLGMTTVAGRELPVEWRVTVPEHKIDVTVSALNDNAWMETSVPYWEGPISITGSHSGRGYLEMTGY